MRNFLKICFLVIGICFPCAAWAQSIHQGQSVPVSSNEPQATDGTHSEAAQSNNVERLWQHTWCASSNGWRVQVDTSTGIERRGAKSSDVVLIIQWGGVVGQSITQYMLPPNGKFKKFELKNSSGKTIHPRSNAGTNLVSAIYSNPLVYLSNSPAWASPSGGSLESDFPATASIDVYPRTPRMGVGMFVLTNGNDVQVVPKMSLTNLYVFEPWVSFVSNEEPETIGVVNLSEVYSITQDGEYTITVQPVLYKRYNPTNDVIIERVDLPQVTTKVHLFRNVQERHPFPRR
jgi:hypothetical protein